MRLVANWQAVLKRAWSIHLMALCVALIVLDAALPLLPLPIPDGVLRPLAALVGIAAIGARLLVQRVFEKMVDDPAIWEAGDGREDTH